MLLGRLREQIEAEGTAGAGAGNPNEPGQRTLVIDEDRCAVSFYRPLSGFSEVANIETDDVDVE